MKTIKASLKINKNGRLYCSIHQTYKVLSSPKNGCTICWMIYEQIDKQTVLDTLLENVLKGKKGNESH